MSRARALRNSFLIGTAISILLYWLFRTTPATEAASGGSVLVGAAFLLMAAILGVGFFISLLHCWSLAHDYYPAHAGRVHSVEQSLTHPHAKSLYREWLNSQLPIRLRDIRIILSFDRYLSHAVTYPEQCDQDANPKKT